MDRSEAATTLFLWYLKGERDLIRAAGRDGDSTLLALVESVVPKRAPRRRSRPAGPPIDFLRLDEEREVEALRTRVQTLLPLLTPEERASIEANLRGDLMPVAHLARVRAELDRIGGRLPPGTLEADLRDRIAPPAPEGGNLRALLLFSRDGRLLASEGKASSLDLSALSQLVARGEPGSTWSLAHRSDTLVGHLGHRAALIVVFSDRPGPKAGGTLRVSLESLERRGRLLSTANLPASHDALTAYLRAVRVLLRRNA